MSILGGRRTRQESGPGKDAVRPASCHSVVPGAGFAPGPWLKVEQKALGAVVPTLHFTLHLF